MTAAPAIRLDGRAILAGAPLFDLPGLTLQAGCWSVLLGPSGVGKSTILRLIAGLDTGATFEGDIVATDNEPLEHRVAYMAQEDLLLPWSTVRRNIAIGARLRGEAVDHAKVDDLLRRVGLTDHATKKPHALSGGQRQRVALARTLMEDKPVILLDEPFSALDARTRAEMQELAFDLLADRTVLLVTHDPSEAARLGHSIVVLTERGLKDIAPPNAPAPRPVDDPDTLQVQGALFRLLREPAS